MSRLQRTNPASFLPLSPQTFQILLSLHDAPLHGYAIIQDIRERTGGDMRLTASTLYDALARLLDQELIVETANGDLRATTSGDVSAAASSRRRYYTLSPLGRDVAAAEARRLERLVAMAQAKLVR
jgi:DNA-binding PadR family transcriptional regulator